MTLGLTLTQNHIGKKNDVPSLQGMEICSTSKLPLSLVNKRADRPYAHSVIDQVKNGKTISDRHTHIFSSQDYIQTFR